MNIFEYKGYYQDYLDKIGVDLQKPFDLGEAINLDIDHKKLLKLFNESENKQSKFYRPRPFHPYADMLQATCLAEMGYNKHNTTETNIGLEDNDNFLLKLRVGNKNLMKLGLDPKNCLIRLLEYKPGTGIPLHTDSYNAFRNKYGNNREATRFFVAVSPWDWGHMLQVHDKIITHWKSGDAYEIPEGIYHLSVNFGITPKYTLTITGFKNE